MDSRPYSFTGKSRLPWHAESPAPPRRKLLPPPTKNLHYLLDSELPFSTVVLHAMDLIKSLLVLGERQGVPFLGLYTYVAATMPSEHTVCLEHSVPFTLPDTCVERECTLAVSLQSC